MCVCVCVCVFVSILHIVMLELFVGVYIVLAFVQLWITFSISMYIMCVMFF